MLFEIANDREDAREHLLHILVMSEVGDTASTTAMRDAVDRILDRYDVTPKRSFIEKTFRKLGLVR